MPPRSSSVIPRDRIEAAWGLGGQREARDPRVCSELLGIVPQVDTVRDPRVRRRMVEGVAYTLRMLQAAAHGLSLVHTPLRLHTRPTPTLMRARILAVALLSCTAPLCLAAQAGSTYRGVIHGVVLDSVGRPVTGSLVVLHRRSLGPQPNPKDSTDSTTAIALINADSAGRFRFDSLAPATYRLSLEDFFTKGEAGPLALGPNDSISVAIRPPIRWRVETPDSVRERRLAELAAARARWAAHKLSRYRLTARIKCLCFGMMEGTPTLEFRGSSLVGIVDSSSGRVRKSKSMWLPRFAVTRLFATAEDAIRNPAYFVKNIEYDPTFGFPTVIDTDSADWHTDGYYGLYVSAFHPLK
jgi:hypothetical protein